MAEKEEAVLEVSREVEDHGWHISAVEAEDDHQLACCAEGEALQSNADVALAIVDRLNIAYTIGLWKSYRQPELVMVGLPVDELVQVLGDIATDVKLCSVCQANTGRTIVSQPKRGGEKLAGKRVAEESGAPPMQLTANRGSGDEAPAEKPRYLYNDGDCTDRYVESATLMFRELAQNEELYEAYMGVSCEYYESLEKQASPSSDESFTVLFPALQVLWPDRQGRYPYEAACSPHVKYSQPLLTSSVVQENPWPFLSAGPDQGVLVSVAVAEGEAPAVLVLHDSDGDWHVLGPSPEGATNGAPIQSVVTRTLEQVLHLQPGIAEAAFLAPGQQASLVEGSWQLSTPAKA